MLLLKRNFAESHSYTVLTRCEWETNTRIIYHQRFLVSEFEHTRCLLLRGWINPLLAMKPFYLLPKLPCKVLVQPSQNDEDRKVLNQKTPQVYTWRREGKGRSHLQCQEIWLWLGSKGCNRILVFKLRVRRDPNILVVGMKVVDCCCCCCFNNSAKENRRVTWRNSCCLSDQGDEIMLLLFLRVVSFYDLKATLQMLLNNSINLLKIPEVTHFLNTC